ncbi:MAG: P13 family porin [Spirochaetota bacterium]
MKRMVASILASMFAMALIAQERPITVGIIEFQGGSGISAIDARTVSEVFRSELVTTGVYTVLERGKMDEILKEQQFQQTGCTSTECAVKLGKLLNMQKMLYGTMSKLGSRYYFVVTIVDIETSRVEKSVNDSMEGLDDLSKAVKRLIEQIIGGKRLIKAGESPFLKVHTMVKTDLLKNVDAIKKEAPYITDSEKLQLVNQFRKGFFGELLLNVYPLPGFGVGSFVQGDVIGGLVLIGISGTGVACLSVGLGGGNQPLTSVGAAVWIAGIVVGAVWPIVYSAVYNDALNKSLGVQLAFEINGGSRYACGVNETFAAAAVAHRF